MIYKLFIWWEFFLIHPVYATVAYVVYGGYIREYEYTESVDCATHVCACVTGLQHVDCTDSEDLPYCIL